MGWEQKEISIMSLFKDPSPDNVENWVCVYESNQEYEAQLIKNYLSDKRIPSNILSKRDSAYNLNVGDMAIVYLYVPVEFEEKARQAIKEIQESGDDIGGGTEDDSGNVEEE